MCCYTALLRVVARFHDDIFSDPTSPSGLNKVCSTRLVVHLMLTPHSQRVDFRSVTITHDAKLAAFMEEWTKRFAQESDANGE
jgi:hypothetical protein